MKILVFTKPGARHALIKKLEDLVPGFDASFSVAVREPAEGGRANRAVEAALAKYFNVSASSIKIVAGRTVRRKVAIVS